MLQLHGRTALVVIDVQQGEVEPEDCGIPIMPGGAERHDRIRQVIAAACAAGVPPIFIQEVHKRSLVDFGRELDGVEGIHGLGARAAARGRAHADRRLRAFGRRRARAARALRRGGVK